MTISRKDIIFVQPYPFSDHPSFPEALLKRSLEGGGFSVGVIETARWQTAESFKILGPPRLFFAVIPGPVDSIVLNYTSSRKRRREDLYQFGGQAFFPDSPASVSSRIRPDRTVIVYANRLREAFPGVPIIIGGIEASLRRFSHYDFQQEQIRRSILFDSRADLLVTGMGEKQVLEIARLLSSGKAIQEIDIPGTARILKKNPFQAEAMELPAHEEIIEDPTRLLTAQIMMEQAMGKGSPIWQPHADRGVWENRPANYTGEDLNEIYGKPYQRIHPGTKDLTPALRMNLFSVTSHRGCSGGCSFCAIRCHQGKSVISRSPESILAEIASFAGHPQWKGSVSDIGGPTAEMYGSDSRSGDEYLALLRRARKIGGIEHILIGSGVRFDALLKRPELLEEIMRFHSGRFLRIAPEHTEDHILKLMHKPTFGVLQDFLCLFREINRNLQRKIELACYLIVGHPGEHARDVQGMKKKLSSLGIDRVDVQIFTPTPGTLSSAMYATMFDVFGNPLIVEKNITELEKRLRVFTR